jgi:MFS family permease
VLAQGFTRSWTDLLICRLFMGLGMGIKISTIPIYSAEVSPAAIRGAIVTSFQLYVAFGILVVEVPVGGGVCTGGAADGADLVVS